MRYVSPALQALPESVPLPLPPNYLDPPSENALAELIQRKRDADKNRASLHLTQADGYILLTNATEVSYNSGDVIFKEGDIINESYRVKSGLASCVKWGAKIYEAPRGVFVGRPLICKDSDGTFKAKCDLIANGPVTLYKLNRDFIRALLDTDKVLCFKIYRYLASHTAIMLHTLLDIALSRVPPKDAPLPPEFKICRESSGSLNGSGSLSNSGAIVSSDSSNSLNSLSSSGSAVSSNSLSSSGGATNSNPLSSSSGSDRRSIGSSGSSNSSSNVLSSPSLTSLMNSFTRTKGNPKSKCKTVKMNLPVIRSYDLKNTGHSSLLTCHLDAEKVLIKWSNHGFTKTKKIKHRRIIDVAKTRETYVTISYDMKARTLIFPDTTSCQDFCQMLHTLLISLPKQDKEFNFNFVDTQNPLKSSGEILSCEGPHRMEGIPEGWAITMNAKKGDMIVCEGDLFQRIYVLATGSLDVVKNGHKIATKPEGAVFGASSYFYLRPFEASFVVSSESATLLVYPHFKMQQMINNNFTLAIRLYKKALLTMVTNLHEILSKCNCIYDLTPYQIQQ